MVDLHIDSNFLPRFRQPIGFRVAEVGGYTATRSEQIMQISLHCMPDSKNN